MPCIFILSSALVFECESTDLRTVTIEIETGLRDQLANAKVREMLFDTVKGVNCLHANGIVDQDLSRGNLLLTDLLRIKVRLWVVLKIWSLRFWFSLNHQPHTRVWT